MKAIRWIPMAAALLVAGCQTWGPTWSELTGDRYTIIDPERSTADAVHEFRGEALPNDDMTAVAVKITA